MPTSPEMAKHYLDRCYEKLPFALRSERAKAQIVERAEGFADELFREAAQEPVKMKRKIW